MKVLLATNSQHKITEITALLPDISLATPQQAGIVLSPHENGTSFIENAIIKARAFYEAAAKTYTVLAEDSGIVVPALDNQPGIYSARFGNELANPPTNDKERAELLLQRLHDYTDRSAYYVCAAVVLRNDIQMYCVQEQWVGTIATQYTAGPTGFGYDPVFIPNGCNEPVSQLAIEYKMRHSHRALAMRAAKQLLSLNGQRMAESST